jgi:hypothetical protein
MRDSTVATLVSLILWIIVFCLHLPFCQEYYFCVWFASSPTTFICKCLQWFTEYKDAVMHILYIPSLFSFDLTFSFILYFMGLYNNCLTHWNNSLICEIKVIKTTSTTIMERRYLLFDLITIRLLPDALIADARVYYWDLTITISAAKLCHEAMSRNPNQQLIRLSQIFFILTPLNELLEGIPRLTNNRLFCKPLF